MSKIVADTNVWVAYFLEREPVASFVAEAILSLNVVLSVVSVSEFLVKADKNQEKEMLRLVDEVGVIPVTKEIALEAVRLRKQALKKSKKQLMLDCYIAATAKVCGAELVTFDKHDYPFTGVKIKVLEY